MVDTAKTKITGADLKFGNKEQTEFIRKVHDKQVQAKKRSGKKYYAGVPAGQLFTVEGRFKMKKKAAEALKKLLKQAREDLAEAVKNKDKHALKIKSIGIHNTYRDPESEKKNYESAFGTQYRNFLSKKYKIVKDRHSDKAVAVMYDKMRWVKAPIGFSNHTSGIAVDFKTTEDGLGTLGPKTSQEKSWKKSWLYEWLGKNDSKFEFKRLKSEQWHWDYTGKL